MFNLHLSLLTTHKVKYVIRLIEISKIDFIPGFKRIRESVVGLKVMICWGDLLHNKIRRHQNSSKCNWKRVIKVVFLLTYTKSDKIPLDFSSC